jgi:L-aspartate oxidase
MYDILVLGAGISGLSAAIHAAEKGLSVVILTKGAKPDGSSNYAQGGIATVTEKTDKFKFHIDDTLEAGAGLCKKEPVNILTKSGPDTIRQLVKWGVQFTPDPTDKTQFDLHLEGGHSHHRILHAADLTGKEIMRALLAELHNHKNIHYIENCYIKDLICKGEGKAKRCVGAKIIHQKTGIV